MQDVKTTDLYIEATVESQTQSLIASWADNQQSRKWHLHQRSWQRQWRLANMHVYYLQLIIQHQGLSRNEATF